MELYVDEKKSVISNLIWKFSERIIAQFVSTIVSIILARLLTPDDYGVVALVMIFITIANVFVSNGFGSALIQKKDADDTDFSSVFFVNIIVSIILYLILFVGAKWIAVFYERPMLVLMVRVLSIRIPIAAINSVQQAYVSKNMMFKRFFWSTLFGTLISGIVGIIMAYNGFGVWALVAQYLINTGIDTLVLWFTVKWRPVLTFSLSRVGKLLSFGWKVLLTALLDTGFNQLRALLIGKCYTSSDLAFYGQGEKYPSLIVTNVNASIGSVLFPVLSKYQDNKDRMKQMMRRSMQVSSYVMWPMMFGIIAVAEPFVKVVLTDKWLPCVPFLRIFCIVYGVWPIHTANLQAISALGRSDISLKLEIIKKVLVLITLLVSIRYSPLIVAYAALFNGIIGIFINAFPNKKLLNYKMSEQIRDIASSFGLAFLMAVVVYPIQWLDLSDIMILVIQVLVGVGFYIFVSVILKLSSFFYIYDFVCGLFKKNNYTG